MVIAVIGSALLVFGGAALVFQIAGDRGRDGSAWALLSIAASGLAGWLAWNVGVVAEDPGVWAGFLPVIAAALAHVAVSVVVIKLPPSGFSARGSRWQMDILGVGREAQTASVELGAGRLRIARDRCLVIEIPFEALRAARSDGETLKLSWEGGSDELSTLVLTRHDESVPRAARVRFCDSLARRLRAAQVP